MQYTITQIRPFGLLIQPKQLQDEVSDLDVAQLRELARCHHLIVLRGFRSFQDAESFAQYSERWGQISIWPFGKVLELVEQDNPKDHIFDNSYVPLHWDGMYRLQVPEFQIFHCVNAPLSGEGGKTTFSNTILALQDAAAHTKNLWHKVNGIYQRKMEFYHSKTISPIISKHPHQDVLVIRYNEPPAVDKRRFINPPVLEFIGISHEQLDTFHQSLKQSLYSPNNFYAHEWQTGDILIADNFSLLHGREAFITQCQRHLRRVHVLSDPPFTNPCLASYQ